MGIIPSELSEAYNSTPTGRARIVNDGDYTGTVTYAELGDSKKPWVNTSLNVRIKEHDSGAEFWINTEVTPLTDRDGNTSTGKIKFLKWQLESLGYTGKLEDLEDHVHTFVGKVVDFNVTTNERGYKEGKLLREHDAERPSGGYSGDSPSVDQSLIEAFDAVDVTNEYIV